VDYVASGGFHNHFVEALKSPNKAASFVILSEAKKALIVSKALICTQANSPRCFALLNMTEERSFKVVR